MKRKSGNLILEIGVIWFFGVLTFTMGYWPALPLLGLYTLAMTIAFIVSPRIGLAAFIMVTPFELHLAEAFPVSPYFALTPGMIAGYVFYCSRVGRKIPFDKEGIFLGIALLAAAAASFISSDLPPQYRVLASLVVMILIFLVSSSVIRYDREALFSVGHGLVVASVIGGVGGFLYIGGSEYDTVREMGAGGRIAIGGNVRAVANIVGLSLFVLMGSALLRRSDLFFHEKEQRIFPFERNVILRTLLILLFGFFLAASATRGMIVAVAAALVALIVVSVLFSGVRQKRFQLSYWAFPVIGIAVYSVLIMAMTYVDPEILGGQLRIRMERLIEEPLSDPRIAIWTATLGQMSGNEWIFGTGLGTFRWVAAQAGFYFYAHSVFVDLLVELGVFGLLAMLIFLGFIFRRMFQAKNIFGIGLFIFLVLSFSTHGSTSSKAFWITLGLVYGVSSMSELGSRVRKMPPQQMGKRRQEGKVLEGAGR